MHTFKHAGAKVAGALMIVATVLFSAGVLFALPEVAQAVTVSAVGGIDIDTTGPGLDGRDFSVSWTPGTQPAGYMGTRLYILPSNVTVTAGNVQTTGCGGNACQDRAFFFQFQQNQFVVPQFINTDSAGTAWNAATQYKAWIFIDATSDEIFSSAAFSVTSDTVTDTAPPFIDHMPAHAATGGVDAIINSFVFDDQTTASGFASGGADGVFSLMYGATLTVTESTVNGVQVNGSLFKFTVPAASVPSAGGAFQYYLKAQDAASNTTFFCANPSATTAIQCKSSPFIVNTMAAGSRTISGTVFQNSGGMASALSGAYVFAGGYATAAVTSATDGTYTLTGLPNNDAFDVTAMKVSYTKNKRFETVGTSNISGINLNLNQGEMMFSGPAVGGAGPSSGGAPHVMFSGPSENVFGVLVTEKIRVGFDQALNASTVNDSNAADAGSPVYLTTDDGSTKIAGSTLYCANQAAAGCSTIYTGDQNTILFTPAADLTPSTFYTFVITESVTSQTGQSVEGNRPGGGHRFSFTTGGTAFSGAQVTSNFGSSGAYMPPYVRGATPAPGMSVAPNMKLLLEFNARMNTGTITTANIQLIKLPSTTVTTTLSADSTEQKFVTITPSAALEAGEYEIRVKGSVADTSGITMMPPNQASSNAFVSNFTVSGTNDVTAPTIYPMITTGTTGISVNSNFQFGFSEQLALSTLTSSNVTLSRGSTSVSAAIKYEPGSNAVTVVPDSVLAPNTAYTVTFGTGVTDLAGVALASSSTYTYTTGDADTTAPKVTDARCDDNTCAITFSERMNQHTQVDANYATSVLKPANITVDVTSDGAPAKALNELTGLTLSYDSEGNKLTIRGLAGSAIALTSGSSFTFTVNSGVTDLSGNAIGGTNNAWSGKAESSASTFGNFGGGGMFGPPTAIAQGGTSTFKPEGFGNFSASQFAFGQADEAFPFNQTASQDVNVFHVRFNPGIALQNSDSVVLTFPTGTTIASVAKDDYSPFKNDLNEGGSGTVTMGTLAADTAALTVTIPLTITGTPGANDSYTLDLKKITNPSIPKGPETGGYTVGIKVMRAGSAVVNKTSMPYFIKQAGSRSITVNIYAGSQASPTSGATGSVFLFGGGPSGPMDKNVTITNGTISAVDGTSVANIAYTNLNDGCYFFGTEPQVTLGGSDYFGQMSPEPVCVDSTNTSRTKNIVLTAAGGSASVDLTVKLAGIASFNGADVDIFAGGPGRFVVKTLTGLAAPDAAGYTLRLPSDGNWYVGVGPAMPKGASSTKITTQLPGNPPPPVDLNVSGVGGASPTITMGRFAPAGVSLNSATRTLTITFTTADKVVSGTVTDGTNGLQNVNVFMHAQGFGSPAFTNTNATGAFTLNVSDYGPYEIGAFKDGLPPVFRNIDVQPDGSDAGTDPDIYYKGKQITALNPLVITIKKADYSISGKVLDASNNPIGYAPVFGNDADGNFVGGSTDSSGSYTLFVAAGVWTLRSELPPDKTDACGTFTKTVTVTTESKSSQNITPTTGTCVTLSGTVSIGGVAQANVPVFIDEWDTTNTRPVAAGGFRGTATDSSGLYTAKVAGNKTYRIGTFSPDTGEISTTQAVLAADITANLTVGSTGTITFVFNGGTSTMNAFVEVKKANNKATRFGKQKNGLDSNLAITVQEGTYDYFVDVFGASRFTGQVATGSTATINLGSVTFVALSGNVKDANANNISGVLVTAKESGTGLVTTATTDASGNYTINVKSGTYSVNASRAEYVPGSSGASVALTESVANYDFGGTAPDQPALTKSGNVIRGTVYASDGTTAMTDGFVTATSATGLVITAAVDAQNGAYSLPVVDGTWTLSAKGSRHAETAKTGTVTVAGADVSTSTNITLTADATKSSTAESKLVAANVGGSVDSTTSTGVKLTAGKGVLESGSGNVTVQVEKSFTAPDTANFNPLGDASFNISAIGSTDNTIKDLKGTAEVVFDYTSLVSTLPAGVTEGDLKLAYFSPERGEYVQVEGGFAIDQTSNTITSQTTHFTTFAIVYTPPVAVAAAAAAVSSGGGGVPVSNLPQTSTAVKAKTIAQAETTKVTMAKPISQMTKAEIQEKIAEIQSLIQTLLAQVAQLKGEVNAAYTNVPKGFAFGTVLKYGASSDAVKYLQGILKTEVPAVYGAATPVSGWFGPKTKAALEAFQEKYADEVLKPFGLSKGTGYFGAKTIQKLNALLAK